MPDWIDFKALRAQLRFADVLTSYGVELHAKRNDQHAGFCPLPTHQSKGKRSPSFSANLVRGVWRCFGCGASGNVLDFATRMEGLDPSKPADVRKAAIAVKVRFNIVTPKASDKSPLRQAEGRAACVKVADRKAPVAEPSITGEVVVNAPLDFELKHLDPNHPYLKDRGFTRKTVERFGLGYCAKGLLAGRIAIPLHDALGRLLGYAGRIVDDNAIDVEHPKYLFPAPRPEAA